ncbi:MAG: CFI-box-CTERM domain-containing protein [Nitrospinales bacterium]
MRIRKVSKFFLVSLVFILFSCFFPSTIFAKPTNLTSEYNPPLQSSPPLGELYAERTLIIEISKEDPCKKVLAHIPARAQGRKFSFAGNSLSGNMMFMAVCHQLKNDIRGAVEAKLKDISQLDVAKKKYEATVEGAKKNIYNYFLQWTAEQIYPYLSPEDQAKYSPQSPEMHDKAIEWLNDPQNEVSTYVHAFLESKSKFLGSLFNDYMSGGSWEIIQGLKSIFEDAKDKLDRFTKVSHEVESGETPLADALKKYGFSGDYVKRFKTYEGKLRKLNKGYNIVEAGKTIVGAFQTDDPAQKISGLFDLLEIVGSTADSSNIPIVSLFGTIVKSFGQVGNEMLKQVLGLGELIRAREGFCVGLATHSQRDERNTSLIKQFGHDIRICPIATKGHLKDVYVLMQPPDDSNQLYFWVKDKFIKGRKGGGGTTAMRHAIQLIMAGGDIGYQAYTGKSKDIATIAMVYNTPYPEKKLRGKNRVYKSGVSGLIEEADKVIDEIASQIKNLEGGTDSIGEGGCSDQKMRAYLKKETNRSIEKFLESYGQSSKELKDSYALAFVEQYRKSIKGTPKRQAAYKTYSQFWDKIENISLFKIRITLTDKSRTDGKCQRCAGAKISISVSNGEELAGCKVDKADSRGGFVSHIVTRKNTVTANLTAEAEGKSGTIDIDPEKQFGGFGDVPFVHSESYNLEIPFEEGKEEENEETKADDPNISKSNELLEQLVAIAANAERISNELLTSCRLSQTKTGEANALIKSLDSEIATLKTQIDEISKSTAQVSQLSIKVKALAKQADISAEAAVKAKQETENQTRIACKKAETIQQAPNASNNKQYLQQAIAAESSADRLSKESTSAYKKARSSSDQASGLVNNSGEMPSKISSLRTKTALLKSKADGIHKIIAEARNAATNATGLKPSLDDTKTRGNSLYSQGKLSAEAILEKNIGKEIIKKLDGAIGRINSAHSKPANCSDELENKIVEVETANKSLQTELQPLVAKATSLTNSEKPGENIHELVANASAATDTAEIFSEAAVSSANDAKKCVQLARAMMEKGTEKVSQTAKVAIDTCDFKNAKGLIQELPPGPQKHKLAQAYIKKAEYEKQTRALYDAGKKLYQAGDLAAALAKFEEVKSHTRCNNFIATLDAAIAKIKTRKAEEEKEQKQDKKEEDAKCNNKLSGSSAKWNENSKIYTCACPSDKIMSPDKSTCILESEVAQSNDALDSEPKMFGVVFQMYFLKPTDKPKTIKAPPGADKNTRERIKKQNERIIKNYINNLSLSNTRPEPMDNSKNPLIIGIDEGAWDTYPREIFVPGTKFSAPVKGSMPGGQGKSIPIDSAMLMTVTKVYENMEEIFSAYPQAKKQAQGTDLNQAVIKDGSGSFNINTPEGVMSFGPLAKGWTTGNKNKALKMTKLIISMMGAIDCFIATAAYDDRNAPQLDTLRDFRDKFLLSNSSGSRLVKLYYKYGPGLANEVKNIPLLVFGLRESLDIFVDWLENKERKESIAGKVISGLVKVSDKILSIFTDEFEKIETKQSFTKPWFDTSQMKQAAQ